MTQSEQLYTFLTQTVLPEMEDFMRKLQEHIDEHGMTEELQQDQTGLRALHDHFLELQVSIEEGELEEAQCEQVFNELSQIRQMGNMI